MGRSIFLENQRILEKIEKKKHDHSIKTTTVICFKVVNMH